MSDNWLQLGATALVSVHQNQQHQPSASMGDLNHPQRPRTTPDWNTRNAVMITEAIEDRNNDSGVSPGHYETSPSPERRSSENRSYSSCSVTSHESQPSTSSGYRYAPQENYQNGGMPMDYATSQPTSVTPKPQSNTNNKTNAIPARARTKRERAASRAHRFEFECPLCGVKTKERDVLWEHLKIHYNPNRLEGEPPVPQTVPIPGCSAQEIAQRIAKHEESINYPIINAQGKVKLNRCKICTFQAITKTEFWRHIKIHTKVEKRLFCQYCPFVTDLKHHFEYHMNKQTGAKPFACKQCTYKCVNKSMLSSHMKSHTDVRQFSCAHCSYVTKYCHSLKMHLRKYRHDPGPILNPDGSINLFTTIDVYGTRRGPKQKKQSALKSGNQTTRSTKTRKNKNESKSNQDGSMQGSQLPQNSSSNESQQMMMNPMAMVNPFSGAGMNSMLAMQYNHMLRNSLPVAEPYANHDEATARNINQLRANIIAEFMMVAGRMHPGAAPNNSQDVSGYYNSHPSMDVSQIVPDISAQYANEQERALRNSLEVLDLSTPGNASSDDNNGNNNNSASNIENRQICHPVVNQQSSQCGTSSSNPPKASGTSRRKGRAVKLNRRKVENGSDDGIQSEDNTTERATPDSYTSSDTANDVNFNATGAGNTVSLKCNFCPISFGSETMYTIHMGYHGYNDPYTCNICGQRCEDALSFNVHLSRASHA